MAENTIVKSVLQALKDRGAIVLQEMKSDPVLSPYLFDVKFMEQVVKIDSSYFSYVEDQKLSHVMLRKNPDLLKDANTQVKNDGVAVIIAIEGKPSAILDGNPKFLNSEEHALEAVKKDYKMLASVNKKFKKRYDFANTALNQNLDAVNYIDPKLVYNNKSIATRLIGKKDIKLDASFKKFNKGMRADVEVCKKMAEFYGKENPKLPKQFLGAAKKDPFLAITCISENFNSYKKLHNSMKKNENVNVAFVKLHPDKAKMLGKQIYNLNVAAALVAQNGLYLKRFSYSFLIDEPSVVESAIKQNGAALKYAAKKFRKDERLVEIAVKSFKQPVPKTNKKGELITPKNPLKDHPLNYANKSFRKNYTIMKASVQNEPLSLQFGSKQTKANREIVLEAVKQNGQVIKYASKTLKHDEALIETALKSSQGSKEVFNLLTKKYLKDPKNLPVLLDTLRYNPELYDSYPDSIKSSAYAILLVAKDKPEAVKNLSLEDRQNKKFLQKLAEVNIDAYDLALKSSYKVQADAKFMREMDLVMEDLKTKQGKTQEEPAKTQENKPIKNKSKEDENSMQPVKKVEPIEESKTIIDVAKNFKLKENNNKQAIIKGEYEIESIGNKNFQDLDETSKREIAHAVVLKDACEIKKFNVQEQQDDYTKNILVNMIPVVDAIENEIKSRVQKAQETGENIEFNANFLEELVEKNHNNFKHAESITTDLLNNPLGWKVLVEHACPDVNMSEVKFSARKDLGDEIDTSSDMYLKNVSIKVNSAVKVADAASDGMEPK